MTFICRGVEAFALEYMTKMATAVGTSNLNPLHTKRVVFMAIDSTCKISCKHVINVHSPTPHDSPGIASKTIIHIPKCNISSSSIKILTHLLTCWPSTSTVKLGIRNIERCITAGTMIHTLTIVPRVRITFIPISTTQLTFVVMLIVFTSTRRFSA